MFEIILGQVPEAIYFSLFMILIKEFKTRRVLFTLFMLILYFGLANIFPYNLNFQGLFIFGSYIIMKFIYKEKVIITDLFLFCFACLLLVISSTISYIIFVETFNLSMNVGAIASKFLLIIYILLRRKSLINWYKRYRINWNKKVGKILSLDIRNISLVLLYAILLIVNFWINL